MKKNLFAIVAVVIAISASAFTKIANSDSDLVWFQVDPSTGEATMPSNGVQGDEPPITCPSGNLYCASALSILDGEVTANGNGTFTINSGVDISDPQVRNDLRTKN